MKTIPEIINFFNDDQVYITAEDRSIFTFSDLKKQIDWTKDFFRKNHQQKYRYFLIKTDTFYSGGVRCLIRPPKLLLRRRGVVCYQIYPPAAQPTLHSHGNTPTRRHNR